MVKVLIVAGNAVEAQEIFYPYYRLREEGLMETSSQAGPGQTCPLG